MAFKKTIDLKRLPLTSLIDVIFLILIFFMITSLEGFQKIPGKISDELGLPSEATDLPRPIEAISPDPDKPFPDLLIRIRKAIEEISSNDSLVFYILDKDLQTLERAQEDSAIIDFGFPQNYLANRGPYPLQDAAGKIDMLGIRTVSDRIDFIQNRINPYPTIEIMAYKQTKFSSIVQIFKLCRDKGITRIKFWVIRGQPRAS